MLNHDQSDPTKKFLLLNAAPATAAKNGDNPLHPQFKGSRRLSQVEASADGVVWRLLSEASEFPHHHEQRILWDPAIREWVGYSQYSHHQNPVHKKRQIGRQTSPDFVNWSPKEVVVSADWETNQPPDLEVRCVAGHRASRRI